MPTNLQFITPREGTEEFITIEPGIDLIYGVSVSGSQQVTSIPVESGRSITDNAVEDPDVITIKGVVGDLVIEENRDSDQPKNTWALLQDWKKRKLLLTLVTELDVYENLIIKRLNNNEGVSTGVSLFFTMTLQQIEFTVPQFTTLNSEVVDPVGAAANRTEQVDRGVINANA